MTDEQKQAFWQVGRRASERLLIEMERVGIVASLDDPDALPALFSWFSGLMSAVGTAPEISEAEFARAVAVQIQFYKPNSSVSS